MWLLRNIIIMTLICCIDIISGSDEDSYDILIIGAGLTGLAHTHLLSTLTDNNYKTLTVERFNRICGRTHSSTLTHDGKSISFEHGAMRFYYNKYHQKFLHRMGLCDNIVPFYHKYFGDTFPTQNFLLRNSIKRGYQNTTDLIEYFAKTYNIKQHEIEWMYDPDMPREIGYNEILEENKDKKRADFWSEWTLRGILVRDWGQSTFWKNVLNVSQEYYNYENRNGRLLTDINVAMMFLEWTAMKGIHITDNPFPIHDDENMAELTHDDCRQEGGMFWDEYIEEDERKYYTLDIGYDSICKRLYENVTNDAYNNAFLFEYNVISIDKQKNVYKVTLQNVYNGDIKNVYANKVISTIAPVHLSKLLENIDFGEQNTPKYNDYIQNDLLDGIMAAGGSYKVSLIYDDTWWNDTKLAQKAGHLLTDLNIASFLMEESWTNDTLTVVHFYVWGQLQSELFHKLQQLGPKYEVNDSIKVDNAETLLVSSSILVNETIKQLRELTEIYDIPLPLAAYSSPLGHNFSDNAGVYRYKYGYNIEYILENIIKPIKAEDFYITTSSISPYYGWQYGALWAAITNIKQNFGVKDPLKNEDTCLPDPNLSLF